MKKLLYQLPCSRSFQKLLSILAFAVVAFAAMELLVVQEALAGVWCCNSTKCICDASLACPSTHPTNSGKLCYTTGKIVDKGTINSTIECTGDGSNVFDSTSVSRDAILDCTVRSDDAQIIAEGVCQLNLTYSRANLAQCIKNEDGTSTLKHEAFCKDVGSGPQAKRLSLGGTLNCCDPTLYSPGEELPAFCTNSDPILTLGIAGEGNCSMFPADPDLGLAEGQVLSLSQIFNNDSCKGPPTFVSDAQFRYCNGNSFDGGPVDCTFGSKDATIQGTTDNEIQADVDFSPEVLNVTCNNNDVWRFRIFGNQSLDPALINVPSLTVEGFGNVTCGDVVVVKKTKQTYRECEIPACTGTPNLGRFVAENRNADLTFDLTVQGSLESGTAIIGEQHVDTSGQ